METSCSQHSFRHTTSGQASETRCLRCTHTLRPRFSAMVSPQVFGCDRSRWIPLYATCGTALCSRTSLCRVYLRPAVTACNSRPFRCSRRRLSVLADSLFACRNLGNNQLLGPTLPSVLGQLTSLRTLYLNDGQYESMPTEIGSLQQLTYLCAPNPLAVQSSWEAGRHVKGT